MSVIKKAIVMSLLVLTILTSIIAGTMANYTTQIDNIASGSVVGKEFIFLEDGQDTFNHNIKIAPTETVIWNFGVKNFDGNIVTETDLYYQLLFDVIPTFEKNAIDPLVVTVKDEMGNIVDQLTGTGILSVNGHFPLQLSGQSASYTVEIYWPSKNNVDINYAGSDYSTTINVSAVASQFQPNPTDPDPDIDPDPDPEYNGDISVSYITTRAWYNNNKPLEYKYQISVTNNSDQTISGWSIDFNMEGNISGFWDTKKVSAQQVGNYYKYRFINPEHYNINIAPGESIVFGGLAWGDGNNNISNVTVNGINVTLAPFTPHTFES